MSKTKIVLASVMALALAGCASDGGPKENAGTVGGALAGALIGSTIGGGTGERVGAALAGAAIGGLIGNRIGASLDDQDKRYAYEAEMNALERGRSGAAVAWRNPDSGRYGNIVPGPAYDQRGTKCRSYTHTIYINGSPEIARGTACRNPDGTWTPVS
ncbi:RT0821/Lpp0805 family surface protein [Bradyrhizobium sp. 2TAF24]|uniref:RT0821/Lpp0805 family surface protein n=1 Tax=Bradyrhizobium sp. 2TAF24 TaxID=3233011 RepID=UPI003F93D5A5